MKRRTSLILGIVVASVFLWTACGSGENSKAPVGETVRGVQLETVRMQELPDVYEATGTVRSATTSVIAAQIGGTVLEMRVKAGDYVKRGQVLAVLDDRAPRAQLAAAQAGLEEVAQGAVEIEQAILGAAADRQFAEATYKRYQGLIEKNSVSKQEFEGAESRYKAALANERALLAKKKQIEARGQQAQSQRESAQAVFSYSRVTSPMDGVVAVKSVDAGTVVMPGMPIVTVEDPGRYRLEASVPEQLISHAQLGTTVAVNTGRGTFQGRVSEVVPSADTESRTFQVKIDLPRDCGCRSGEYGTAGIPIGQTKRMTVPRRAILGHGQLEGVFVAAERGIVEFRLVKTGKGLGERIEILAGLAEGERVATSQVGRLRDGVRVEGE